jgi:hypothetical protein
MALTEKGLANARTGCHYFVQQAQDAKNCSCAGSAHLAPTASLVRCPSRHGIKASQSNVEQQESIAVG